MTHGWTGRPVGDRPPETSAWPVSIAVRVIPSGSNRRVRIKSA
jgi:hypothetical protein